MFITGNSNLILAVCGLFAIGFLGSLLGAGLNIVSGIFKKKKTSSTATANFEQQLAEQKRQFESKMAQQAEQNKKTMMMVGIGAVVLIFMIMMFMRKK